MPVTTPSNPYPNHATSYIPGQSMPHHIPAGNAQQQQVASNASRLINQLINQANSKRKHSLPLTTAAGAAGLVVSMSEAGGPPGPAMFRADSLAGFAVRIAVCG